MVHVFKKESNSEEEVDGEPVGVVLQNEYEVKVGKVLT